MKKILNPVGINIETSMDADDLGQRLVDCVRQCSSDANVVNLIKIKVGDNMRLDSIHDALRDIICEPLKEMGVSNCIFVPLKEGFIEDITIDYIEVVEDNGTNN